jgi:macrolide-specific efflux system membrane fusion protein
MKSSSSLWRRRALLGVAILGAALGFTRWVVRSSAAAEPRAAVVVAERRAISLEIREVGTVEPFRKIDLKSKIEGQVAKVHVDVGAQVKVGDLLAELDPIDRERDLEGARAHRETDRAQLLHAQNLLRLKKSAYEAEALPALDMLLAQGDVSRLEAQLRADAVEIAQRQDRLGYTKLRSPIDGVVLERNVQPGEMVTPGVNAMVDGRPLLVVAQLDRVIVRAELSQLDVPRVRPGQAVEVTVDALPGRAFRGEVLRTTANGRKSERRKDATLLVFPVDVVVDRSQPGADAILPGMVAGLRVGHGEEVTALAVPLEAIERDGDRVFVRKRAGESPGATEGVRTEVTLGVQDDRAVEILSGLSGGETLVLPPALVTPPAG